MKNSLFEKYVNTFAWIAYGLTCFLSIYAVHKIMSSTENWWWIIAIAAGLVVNTTEMLSWQRNNKNKHEKDRLDVLINRAHIDSEKVEYEILKKKREAWHPKFIVGFMAILSICGTFFSLQSGYNRGAEISKVQEAIVKQLALSEGIIREYQLNSGSAREQAELKRRLSNMYLNKSDDFLKKATDLLGSNAKELEYLKNNVENKVAMTIYDGYTALFGGNPLFWSVLFNTLLAIMIECGFLYLSYEAYYINNPLAYIKELGEKEVKVPQIKRKQIEPIPQIASANTVQKTAQIEPQIKEQVQISSLPQNDNGNGANRQTVSKKKTLRNSFASGANGSANKKQKRKRKFSDMRSKIVYAWYEQKEEMQRKERKEINESEIANKVQTTRQNVDYWLRKENLK